MRNLVNFGKIALNGKFVHNSCLFIKGEDNQGTQVGSKDSIRFEDEYEVGEVVAESHAPDMVIADDLVNTVSEPEEDQEEEDSQ